MFPVPLFYRSPPPTAGKNGLQNGANNVLFSIGPGFLDPPPSHLQDTQIWAFLGYKPILAFQPAGLNQAISQQPYNQSTLLEYLITTTQGQNLKRSFLRFFNILPIFDKLKFIHMGVEELRACEQGLHRRRCVTKHLAPTPLAYAAGFLLAETVPRKNRPFRPFVMHQNTTFQNKKKKKQKKYRVAVCCFGICRGAAFQRIFVSAVFNLRRSLLVSN